MTRPEDFKLVDILDYASGTADRTSSAVNMAGFEWVVFIVKFATIAASAVTSIKVQQSSDDGATDSYGDIEGSAITIADDDDNQSFAIAIRRPQKQYLKLVVDKDTANATAELAVAMLGGGDKPQLASVTDELTIEIHRAPAEGTA